MLKNWLVNNRVNQVCRGGILLLSSCVGDKEAPLPKDCDLDRPCLSEHVSDRGMWRALSVQMTQRGLVADVQIEGPNGDLRLEMDIDTGSTFSYVSSEHLQEIGYIGKTPQPLSMQTAAGAMDKNLYLVKSVQIVGGPTLGPAAVGVCNQCGHPLLGDQVLQRLNLLVEWGEESPVKWMENGHDNLVEDFRYFLPISLVNGEPVIENLTELDVHDIQVLWCDDEWPPLTVKNLASGELRYLTDADPCEVPSASLISVLIE
ncbi:MAG: aspartyl protease family protein [Alphaproteobacteria bacterium]|nr:aspartyl protease family protein [Alphaproteobacteria bacterium]MCB9791209.1 aspartyl protease family protein [Alphaproteobacteria bacterium]